MKEKIESYLFTAQQDFAEVNSNNVVVEAEERVLRHPGKFTNNYSYVILCDVALLDTIYETLTCKEKTVIVFTKTNEAHSCDFFSSKEVVFSYSYSDAVNDGYLTPAMDSEAFTPTVEVFIKHLLNQFGYIQVEDDPKTLAHSWDMIVKNAHRKIWIEYKTYKSQVVSPSAAVSLLNTIVMKKMKQGIPDTDIILLVVFSNIPSFKKDEIFKRHRVIVWDIENLVFYSKNRSELLRRLSQITYFSIDHIKGQPSEEAEMNGLVLNSTEETIIQEAEKEVSKANELIERLKLCETGKEYSSKYENICEEILRTLFEASYFNRLTRQYKTRDEHFRMDLIGALKVNQLNEENIHPLWQILVQHYNSHFIVFEFKNYSGEVDQNQIYITEKYLFDAALRNVAFIISRKGFSKAAKFAAEGALKEHGKLILNVTDEDLIQMLELKGDKAADYLLEKLEDFLMGISK